MEESSHSTPSPMSSAASSQDSLHRNAATLHYQHQLHHQNPYGNLMTNTLPANTHLGLVNKKKAGVKSTLGRIFGKKDKHHIKSLQAGSVGLKSPAGSSIGSPQVSGPIPNSASLTGGFLPSYPMSNMSMYGNYAGSECDYPSLDGMTGSMGIMAHTASGGPKGDFDRRKKKRYAYKSVSGSFICLLFRGSSLIQ